MGVAFAVAGEGMAGDTVGTHTRAEALLRQARRVLDACSRLVTRRATTGRDRSHGSCAKRVTGVAGDPMHLHMHAVPCNAPVLAPIGLNIDPSAGGAA